jgi:hypothetical protein
MSEENSPKEEKIKIHQEQPEIQKGQVPGVSEYTKLHSERGTLREGYQPITDISSTPPDGGSGVPEKKDDK